MILFRRQLVLDTDPQEIARVKLLLDIKQAVRSGISPFDFIDNFSFSI